MSRKTGKRGAAFELWIYRPRVFPFASTSSMYHCHIAWAQDRPSAVISQLKICLLIRPVISSAFSRQAQVKVPKKPG